LKSTEHDDRGLTQHGSVMGTPQYISPEQAMGEDADERSDIYSLGATFFHLLCGRLAFEEANVTSLLMRISRDEAPPMLSIAPTTPRPLCVIIERMMANRREERYQNVHVLLEDLQSYIQRGLLVPSTKSLTLAARRERPADLTQAMIPQSEPDY
jgi:serine/threonine protein kinase